MTHENRDQALFSLSRHSPSGREPEARTGNPARRGASEAETWRRRGSGRICRRETGVLEEAGGAHADDTRDSQRHRRQLIAPFKKIQNAEDAEGA